MRTLLSHVPGGPENLVLEQVPDPVPGDNQVLIRVHAAALNYPDLLLIQDLYQMRPPRPFAPGSEVAGEVEAVGANVRSFKIGDRVIGMMGWGGVAEKALVTEQECLAIADSVSYAEAAALLVTYGTSHYALLERARIKPGECLVVLGAAGGVGLAAVQLGKAFGARVIAAASSAEKADLAARNGADAVLVYPRSLSGAGDAQNFTEAIIAACAPAKAADVVFDPVGGAYSMPAFRSLAAGGRHLVLGFTAGIARLPLDLAAENGAAVLGVFYGMYCAREPVQRLAYLREVIDMHANGVVRPHVGHVFSLQNAAKGFSALQSRSALGKVVVTFDDTGER